LGWVGWRSGLFCDMSSTFRVGIEFGAKEGT
jgi:hypothetical protein